MMPRLLLYSVFCLLYSAASAAAQDRAEARTVTAVHIEIEGRRENAPDLRALIETAPGAPLDPAAARESISQLYAAGRFEDVRVDAIVDGDGIALIYKLQPRHPVVRVSVDGRTGLDRRVLQDALETRFEGLASAPSMEDATAAALGLLHDEGFLFAQVTPRAAVSHDPHQTELTFDVQAGPAAAIGNVQVEGDWPESEAALVERLNAARGMPYRRSLLRSRLEDIVTSLRRAGRYAAAATHTSRRSDDGQRIDVVIDVDAGPIVDVRFEGDVLPRTRLDDLVPIERERAVDIDLLEDSTIRIVNELRREGYWRANASYRTAEQDGRLQVTFTITRGPRFRVGSLSVDGNTAVSDEALLAFVDVRPGDTFVETPLRNGALVVQDYYRRSGFASAEVRLDFSEAAADVERDGGSNDARMDVRLIVTEGEQAFVSDVRFTGVSAIGEDDLRRRMQTRAGEPFYQPFLAVDRDALTRAYLDRGYQQAIVTIEPSPSDQASAIGVTVHVAEGPQTFVDRVIVVGNRSTDTQTILDELTLRQGSPLGLSEIVESQRRLSALGLFRRVRIVEGPRQPGKAAVDLIVTLEEAPATTIGYGAGLELMERSRAVTTTSNEDRLEPSPRGFFEITRRNIAGGNRSVSLFTRVGFGRDDAPGDPARDGKGFGISEYRVVGSYREPRAFAFDTDLLISAGIERAIRTSFSFNRRLLSGEAMKRLTPAVRVSGRYSLEYTTLVDQGIRQEDRLLIDRLFPQFRLSIFSGSVTRDTRDDPVEPSRGMLMALDGDVAPRALGSEVGFIKSFGQAFFFRRVPGTSRVIFAGGARIGLARGFTRIVETPQPDLSTISVEVTDLPASQRFFAGGSTTVRGFQLDRLGVPEILNPDGLSNGGNAMVVLNGEVRLPVWKDLGAVAFFDAGNVFARVSDFDITELRPTAGIGLRYRSPIGPVRVDLGFKLNRQTFPNRRERGSEWHFSLGQAF